jgi:hypothetical protein
MTLVGEPLEQQSQEPAVPTRSFEDEQEGERRRSKGGCRFGRMIRKGLDEEAFTLVKRIIKAKLPPGIQPAIRTNTHHCSLVSYPPATCPEHLP